MFICSFVRGKETEGSLINLALYSLIFVPNCSLSSRGKVIPYRNGPENSKAYPQSTVALL